MKRFGSLLGDIAERLDLRQPAKGRILLEIAADIEDLFDHLLRTGMDEEGAHAVVTEQFAMTDEVLADLVDLHQTRYQRFVDRLSSQAQGRWERTGLALLVLLMAVTGVPVLTGSGFFREASPVIWPLVGLGLVGLVIGAAIFRRLWLRSNDRDRQRRRGLDALLALSVTSVITGIFGFLLELYLALQRLLFDLAQAWPIVIDWLLRGTPVLLLGLLIAMVTALIWFVSINRIVKLEQAEVAWLLADR